MIYITGDTHGDASRFETKAVKKLTQNDIIIVCGDFGFLWNGSSKEKKVLKSLLKRKCTIAFVDGSHENFGRINACTEITWNGGTVHRIAPNIIHLMRGQYYTIDGVTVFTMGGGESDDYDTGRDAGWTGGSLPDNAEFVLGAANLDLHGGKVDVIISHEPSSRIKSILSDQSTLGTMSRINALNVFLEQLAAEIDYKKWFFGSCHVDKRITPKITAVYERIIPLEL